MEEQGSSQESSWFLLRKSDKLVGCMRRYRFFRTVRLDIMSIMERRNRILYCLDMECMMIMVKRIQLNRGTYSCVKTEMDMG